MGSFVNVMDTFVYHQRHDRHVLGLSLPLTSISVRPGLDACSSISPSDSDPIIEDSPNLPPDGEDEIDYSIQTPEIGLQLTFAEDGLELPSVETPLKHVVSPFVSHGVNDVPDHDDYPFEAITYGESTDFLGLPYNDHTYISTRTQPKENEENGDQLSLLAKLALSKQDKPTFPATRRAHGLLITSDTSASTGAGTPSSVSRQSNTTGGAYSLIVTSTSKQPSNGIALAQRGTLITTNHQIPMQNNPSTLQVHRIGSTLTPHIVLRTGIPVGATVQRQSNEPSEVRHCVCGHLLGVNAQCEHCCATLSSRSSTSNRLFQSTTTDWPSSTHSTTPVIQRQNLTINPAIRISRTSALGVTGSQSGRVFVSQPPLAPHPNSQLPSHIQLRLSNTGLSSSEVNPGVVPRYFNLVPHSSYLVPPAGQPVRSSKRKQDLVTLTASAKNNGFECVPDASVITEELSEITSNLNYSDDPYFDSMVTNTVTVNGSKDDQSFPQVDASSSRNSAPVSSSLHHLLANDHPLTTELTEDEDFECDPASQVSSTLSSYSALNSPSHCTSELRLSEQLILKLKHLNDQDKLKCDRSASSLLPTSSTRCRTVRFDFNRKGLVAGANLYPGDPVIEYHGSCMLLSEYSEMHDYRKHYNPYVLFYKNWEPVPLCVDAGKFGNQSRFIRRSCIPNCEVHHILSDSRDADSQSHSSARFQLVVFAKSRISQSTELTIAYDFDYTACRYPVSCACSRKACPVNRWFRQTYVLNGSDVRHRSLPYSRKTLRRNRFGANAARFRSNGQSSRRNHTNSLLLDYDEKEADDSVMSGSLTSNAKKSRSRESSRPTLSHRLKSHSKSNSMLKTRGRRGTNRRATTTTTSSLARSSTKTTRGRQSASGKRLNSFRSHNHVASRRMKEDQKHTRMYSDLARFNYSPSNSFDDTEPEFAYSDEWDSSTKPAPASIASAESPNSHTVKFSTESPSKFWNASQKQSRDRDHKKISPDSTKYIRSPSSAHSGKLINNPQDEEDRKKSQEEIWMAEVLRRIERMEKKKKQGKQSKQQRKSCAASNHVENQQTSSNCAATYSKVQSPTSDNLKTDSGEDNYLETGQTQDCTYSPSRTITSPASFSPGIDKSSETPQAISPRTHRRRRSQAALLSDSLNASVNEQHDTREDRWLKFQLRRIAELEVDPPSIAHSSADASLRTSTDAKQTNLGGDNSQIVALKEVSYNDPQYSARSLLNSSNSEGSSDATFSNQDISVAVSQKSHIPEQALIDRMRSTDTVSNAKRPFNSEEVDCGLIVYRTTDHDPMAKFSRSRSNELTACPTTQNYSTTESVFTTSQENLPPDHLQSDQDVRLSGTITTVTRTTSTPRPTKKRWLSQALMEEDGDLLSNGLTATDDALGVDRVYYTMDNQPPSCSSGAQLTSPSYGPMNPKKRIISQFSCSNHLEDMEQGVPTDSSNKSSVVRVNLESVHDAKFDEQMESDVADSFIEGSYSTPLPPKKATVKQHAEEMRKVRLSLSEYRRRKGLPITTPTSRPPIDAAPSLPNVAVNSPIMDPDHLLDRLPGDLLHLPDRIPALIDMGSVKEAPTIISSQEPHLFNGSTPLGDDNPLDERGPRTPSEPLDDEDFSTTVYLHQTSSKQLETSDAVVEEVTDLHWSPRDDRKNFDVESARKHNIVSDGYFSPHNRRRCSSEEDYQPVQTTKNFHHTRSPLSTEIKHTQPSPKRRHSSTDMSHPDSQLSLADYLIRRDEQIRKWQKMHSSYDWEPKRSTRWQFDGSVDDGGLSAPAPPTAVSAVQKCTIEPKMDSGTFEYRSSKPSISIYNPSNRTSLRHQSHLLDVEETLWRLHDRLRSQLDRAKTTVPSPRRAVTPIESRPPTMMPNSRADYSRYVDEHIQSERSSKRMGRHVAGRQFRYSRGYELH